MLTNKNGWFDLIPDDVLKNAENTLEAVNRLRAEGKEIFPPQDKVFAALEAVPPGKVSVVILGQDPYHEQGQANGFAFSVNDGVKIPPSLRNIFKELRADIGCQTPTSGDLNRWAEQGVLLLNTVLTVEEGNANSHANLGWQKLTGAIIDACFELPQPVVFLLWGKYAAGFAKAESENKVCFCSTHPSPLSASRGTAELPAFFGSKPFSKANAFLVEYGAPAVSWVLAP